MKIVVIGFATIFITFGLLTLVVAAVGGKSFLRNLRHSLNTDLGSPKQ